MRSRAISVIRKLASTLAALSLLAVSRAEAASMAGVTDLGANVSRLQLNNAGQVAGLRPSADGSDGFLYTNGQYTSLAPGVQPISLADNGRVIDARGPFEYFPFGNGDYDSLISIQSTTAGNHLGQLVGLTGQPNGFVRIPENLSYQAFVFTPFAAGSAPNNQYLETLHDFYGQNQPLPTIRPDDPTGRGIMGYPSSLNRHVSPTGINDSGTIIGNYDPSMRTVLGDFQPRPSYSSHAYLNQQDLGTLGGLNSYADAINNAGQVVGKADTASGASHAFLFTKGMMLDLGVLPGMASSEGLGLNDKGDVVGTSGGHAFVFSNGILEDLNDRLPATSGLTLDQAIAINDAGQILAYGHGADGVEHGLLLSPIPAPEPTALALFGLAAAGLGVRFRRISRE